MRNFNTVSARRNPRQKIVSALAAGALLLTGCTTRGETGSAVAATTFVKSQQSQNTLPRITAPATLPTWSSLQNLPKQPEDSSVELTTSSTTSAALKVSCMIASVVLVSHMKPEITVQATVQSDIHDSIYPFGIIVNWGDGKQPSTKGGYSPQGQPIKLDLTEKLAYVYSSTGSRTIHASEDFMINDNDIAVTCSGAPTLQVTS